MITCGRLFSRSAALPWILLLPEIRVAIALIGRSEVGRRRIELAHEWGISRYIAIVPTEKIRILFFHPAGVMISAIC